LRRITKAALGGVASCALIFAASQAASGDSANMTYLLERVPIADLQSAPGPFDFANGTLRVSQAPDETATGFKLTVEDIGGAEGQQFGAHLHTGPCVTLAGSKAGGHYNHETATTGNLTPAVNAQTEVWFNLVPNEHGDATDDTKVQFVPIDNSPDLLLIPGEMSIVIHALPTNTELGIPTAGQKAGYAGDRWACFKLLTPDWAP
jgi:Cu/Zn superoxide dismutase